MNKKFKRIFACCLTVFMILTQMIFNGVAFAESTQSKRLAGSDRYKTAVAISQEGWAKGSPYAIIARGDEYADALSAGPLAQKYKAPILLTETAELNADTLNELKRLKVKNVYIVGGTGAVAQKVEDALNLIGIKVERLWGNDRYETSARIAEYVGNSGNVVLATGADFPDALSISAVAAKLGMPILLTESGTLPVKVREYITNKKVTKTYIIGGTAVISDTVKNLVPGAVRIGGKDRYETNTLVMQEFANNLKFSKMYLAVGEGPNGNEFADALSGAVLAAASSSPVVLVYKSLSDTTANFIKSKTTFATKLIALGGEAVVPKTVVDSLTAFKKDIPVQATYDKAGTYGPDQGTNTVSGNVVISAADVTLRNTIIEGDLVLAESIGNGNVTLNNITVKGNTVVNGGGPNSVIMYNFNGQNVVVDVPDGGNVRLVAQGTTSIGSVEMESNGKLEESGLTGNGFVNVAIPAGASVVLSGSFETVDIQAGGANVDFQSGSVSNLNLNGANAVVNLSSNVTVTNLTASAPVSVTGTGTVSKATIASNGVTMQQTPAAVSRTDNVTEGQIGNTNMGDIPVDGSTGPVSGGGGGGGSTPSITVNGILVQASDSNRSAYGINPSFSTVPNSVVVTGMKFDTAPSGATLVIDQINARNNNWLTTSVTKVIPSDGVITTRDLLGELDSGTLGINLGNLRKVFGSGNVVFSGYIQKSGYDSKSVTVTLTLGTDGTPLPDTISTKWATITKTGTDIEVTVKSGQESAKLDTVGLLPGLASSAVWPYAIRISGGSWKVGQTDIKAAIAARTGMTWDQITLGDIKGQDYDVQIIENSTIFNLTVK